MSAHVCGENDVAVEQLDEELRALAKILGVDPDAPDAVVQFAAALLLAIPSLLRQAQSQSPTKNGRKPTWQAGLYDELYRDVNKTMADLNCSIKAAIAHLLKDRSGRWWTHTQQSLEARYREARSRARDAMRNRLAQLLVQQAALSPQPEATDEFKFVGLRSLISGLRHATLCTHNSSRTLMETSMNRTLEKHGLTIYEACIFSSLGKTKLYEAIKSGELKARKAGKRTLILANDLRHYLSSLPPIEKR